MPEPELFALMPTGTYHRRDCASAKDAENFLPLEQMPAGAKPCGRCDPPPVPAANAETAPDAPGVPPPEPAPNVLARCVPPPELAPNVLARCVRPCTAQGAFRKAGDVLTFPKGAVNPHFTIIGGD